MKPECRSLGAAIVAAAILITTTTLSITAQPWTNRYNGQATALAVDSSGNVYVTGNSYGIGTYTDYATIAYTSGGVPLWTNRYDGPVNGYDGAHAIAIDGSDNVYVTGQAAQTLDFSPTPDYATIKYTSAGVPLWTNRYNGPGNDWDQPSAIAVDGNGNVYVTGHSEGSDSAYDCATIAYSSAGVPLWTNRYNGPGNGRDWGFAITVDGSRNVYVTGSSVGSESYSDYATIAYTSGGVPLWTNRYNGPDNWLDAAHAIAVDSSGNVYVTGHSMGVGSSWDYATIAYTSTGVPLWTRRYNGPANGSDGANAIAVDDSGNVYVTGHSWGSDSGYDYTTIAYTSGGVPLWTRRYNGPANGSDLAQAIALDASGNVYVTGYSEGNDSDRDYLTVAYTSGGVPLWSRRYSGPGNTTDEAKAIAVDGSGNVYVTGQSSGYTTIKYVPPLVDHFTYNPILSPQVVDVPFPIMITAKYLCESNFTFFTNTLALSGYAPGPTATNLTLGTGSNPWEYPLHTSYHDARAQVIYRANELGLACTINSLALEVTTPPGQTLENWTIRLKHTTMSGYSTSPEWEGSDWTVVYQGDEPAGTTGWRTFAFSTPFEYNGTNNLLIDFSFNNAFYSSEGQCQSTVMGTYRSITYASDSKDGDPLTWSGISPTPTRSYNVPNVVLGATYTDLFPVALSPTVTTPFVNGVWSGTVTVHEAVSNLVLRAQSGEGITGESNPFDVVPGAAAVPQLQNCHLSAGQFAFDLSGEPGCKLLIQASTDLKHWITLHGCYLTNSPLGFVDPESLLYPKRYYRLMDAAGVALMEQQRWSGGQFHLNLVGELGRTVIVEASTNLADWTPLVTNVLGSDPIPFTDPQSGLFPQRFYRLLMP